MGTESYERLRVERPDLFVNRAGGIEILSDPEAVAEAGGVMYSDRYITLLRDPVRFPDGSTGTYIRSVGGAPEPGCAVLPLFDGGVVLVEHFRHATRSWHWEVPRGFGEPGLPPGENAAKELREEIGAEVLEVVPLGELHPDSGTTADRVALFAARIDGVGALETAEGIRGCVTVPFAEAEAMVGDGRVTDGFTIAVLMRARLAGLTA
ncbi:NUDIX hydrolase [Streptomyces sp. NPDC006978]|uniref:NUDIX hydrolase n=1 Tax=unclassified Streptomyces TaxID=2593676 RepID=UPI002AFF8C16|nr:NUDIX hydrolase [Streptomyces sp. S584]